MDIFQSIIAARVIIILGIINLVSGGLIFFSCRCIPGARITSKLTRHSVYQRFYKYHCYIWRVFWPSVVVHAILATVFLGVSF
jgi:hypothetical protein